MTLSELALKYGTDKALSKDGTGNNYTPYYEKYFDPIREQTINLLEIGVQFGYSIQMWLEFFPNAIIFGVDNTEGTNPWNTICDAEHAPNPRYKFVHGDQSDPNFWDQFYAMATWDIVVDDGGHFAHQIITTFDCLWPKVRSGGLYIIEDLGCSYSPVYQPIGSRSPMDMLKSKLDAMNTVGNHVDSIFFAKQLAIIRKISMDSKEN